MKPDGVCFELLDFVFAAAFRDKNVRANAAMPGEGFGVRFVGSDGHDMDDNGAKNFDTIKAAREIAEAHINGPRALRWRPAGLGWPQGRRLR